MTPEKEKKVKSARPPKIKKIEPNPIAVMSAQDQYEQEYADDYENEYDDDYAGPITDWGFDIPRLGAEPELAVLSINDKLPKKNKKKKHKVINIKLIYKYSF